MPTWFSAASLAALLRALAPIDEAKDLYNHGQERYEMGDYEGAASAWALVLTRLEENAENSSVREAIVLGIVEADLQAHARDGETAPLYDARETLRDYEASYQDAYGDSPTVSDAVLKKVEEIEAAIAAAEADAETETDGYMHVCLQPCLSPPHPPMRRRGCGGDPYAAFVLLSAVGIRRRRDALANVADRLPPDVVDRLERNLPDDDDDDGPGTL